MLAEYLMAAALAHSAIYLHGRIRLQRAADTMPLSSHFRGGTTGSEFACSRLTVRGSALWLSVHLGKQRKMEQIESQREATDESQLDAAWLRFGVARPL